MGRSLALESRQGRCRGWSRVSRSCAEGGVGGEHISLWKEKSRTGKHRPLLWLRSDLGQAWKSRTGKLSPRQLAPALSITTYVKEKTAIHRRCPLGFRFAIITKGHSHTHAHRAATSLPEQAAPFHINGRADRRRLIRNSASTLRALFTQPLVARGRSRAIGIRGAPPRAESTPRSRSKSPACTRIQNPGEKP